LVLKKSTAADITHLDWNKAIGFRSSSEGSEGLFLSFSSFTTVITFISGVFFVEFEDKSVVSLKGSSTIAADIYALKLAHFVGICVPDFRTLRVIDPEFQVFLIGYSSQFQFNKNWI
jgi:hypothetical protein